MKFLNYVNAFPLIFAVSLIQASDKPQGADIVDEYIETYVKNNVSGSIKPDAAFVTRVLSSQELANYFFSQLNQYPGVSTLYLFFNNIRDVGAQVLAIALAENKTITTLHLPDNQIGDAGATALAENKTITTLHLPDNQIGDAGATALAENRTITTLNLSENQIKDAGATALAKNRTITTLHLFGNMIGDAGATAFAENRTITSLSLFGNMIGDVVLQQIEYVIDQNKKRHRSLLEHHAHQELLPENREASDEATKIGYEAIKKYGK